MSRPTRSSVRAALVGMVKALGFLIGASVVMAVVEEAALAVTG